MLGLEEAFAVICEEVIAAIVVWARLDSAILLEGGVGMGRSVDVVNCGYRR